MFATSIKSHDILKRVISISKISRIVFGSKQDVACLCRILLRKNPATMPGLGRTFTTITDYSIFCLKEHVFAGGMPL